MQSDLTMQVTYSCGCGFRAYTEQSAADHAMEKNHTLFVNGTVRPPGKKPYNRTDTVGKYDPAIHTFKKD